ncbi:hypothetical protein EPUS_05020 [Endocarpon pusillum Z07020]|uniref:DASH complex subunit DAM1 n=1 Tax=Endocarpon pusillum (strain Z07020 / HMAS-L-300199) TaxID=1263415 RepID=U1HUF7_ENDPU|nr:uncharacterized protein EPUS_05020 [Endocarpon pusillum Z07020]ERF72939.1 hypothetical protein EPUS_05020 [Endocarpon pusillum Z07020]
MEATSSQSRARSVSHSRPTTPLRPPSRSSTTQNPAHPHNSSTSSSSTALDTLEPQFAELADSMADLEANFMHLQLMHESLARFGESFAAFLYGLNVRAFCVDFPETPVQESFERWKAGKMDNSGEREGEMTFMTTDTSFVEQGSTSIVSKATTTTQTPKREPPPPVTPRLTNTNNTRGTGPGTKGLGGGGVGGRGYTRGVRGSGLARPRGRGVR